MILIPSFRNRDFKKSHFLAPCNLDIEQASSRNLDSEVGGRGNVSLGSVAGGPQQIPHQNSAIRFWEMLLETQPRVDGSSPF